MAKNKGGRPTVYRKEFCGLLVEHMKTGGSIESFGAKIGHATSSIYLWFEEHEEFSEAKKEGMPHLVAFYENLFKTAGTGQLRRLKAESPARDHEGKIVRDKDGNVVMHREYEAATPAQAVLIFLTKNVLGWRDKKDIELSGKGGGPIPLADKSVDELKKILADLQDEAKKLLKA